MGVTGEEFKKDDEEDSDSLGPDLETEENVFITLAATMPIDDEPAQNFERNDDSDVDSDSDVGTPYDDTSDVNDYDPDDLDLEEESDVESDTSSVKSLGAGREHTEEDELIKKIKKAKKVKRQQPPDIMNDESVTSISFSPANDIIAVGTMDGDICLYSYDIEKTELILKYSAHMGSCRKIEYDESGELLYTISKDKSIVIAEADSGKFTNVYDNAHPSSIYSLFVINKNVFCTGDDDGIVKLWDRRKKEEVFSLKIGENYVSSLQGVDESSTLGCTAGDGSVTGINMNTRRIMHKSEPYSAEILCSGLFCSNTKLAVGTSIGSLLLYSWGQFTAWNDEFPALDKTKHAVNCMVPITENVAITGLDNGTIRATHLFPMRHIGIVGQHASTVEGLDVNRDGTLIASYSDENKVCFWNVEYFEDVRLTDKNKKDNGKAKEHNLPSSCSVNVSDFFAGLA